MPPRVVPCPGCGKPTRADSSQCWDCNVASRKRVAAERYERVFGQQTYPTSSYSVPITEKQPTEKWLKILVIPDTQAKPGVPLDHMQWAGKYAADKRPDLIVHLGDGWDMQSLSSYDVGKKSYEGRRYVDDIDAGNKSLDLFDDEVARAAGYSPDKWFMYGNHEERILRAIEADRKLEGLIGYHDFNLGRNGWKTHEFLQIATAGGVEFSHYFVSGAMGRPVNSAASLLRERQGSAIMGHNQVFQIATHPKRHTMAIFAGCFYQHNERYLSPQDQDHRRQLLMLHETKDGIFDLMMVSLEFLKRRYAA